jgi:hypothetical protein
VNNRELAAVIWLGAFLVWALTRHDVRSALAQFVVALVQPKLLVALLGMLAYLGGLIYLASLAELWGYSLVGDTMAWFVITGFGLFLNSASLFQSGWVSLKKLLLTAIGMTVFVEGFVNLYVFPLVVELLLLPLLVLLTGMSVVAATEDDFAPAKKLADGLLAVIGFILFAYVAVRLITEWNEFDRTSGLQKLALPLWLTLGVLPFIAALAVWAHYDKPGRRV